MSDKKRISKMSSTYSVEIESTGADKSKIVFSGVNTNGVQSKTTVIIEDYHLPYMISGMMKIGKRRLQHATDLHNRIKNAVND